MQTLFLPRACALGVLACAAAAAHAQSAGTWMIKLGVNNINPQVRSGDLSAPSLPDTKIDVKDATSAIVTLAYMYTDNISFELYGGLPYKHDVVGDGSISGVGKIGSLKQISPTLFGQYRFLAADAPLRPYVGVGVTWAHFYDEQSSATMTALTNPGGPPTRFSASSAWGVSPEIGATFRINEKWFVEGSYTKTLLKTRGTLSTGQTIDVVLDPNCFTFQVGYKF